MGTGGVFLRKLRAKVDDRPTGFVWVEDRVLAGTGYPASRSQIEWLVNNGVGSVLTLTETPLPREWVEGLEVDSGHVAMKDHRPPDLESMVRSVDYILDQRNKGKAVAVHCLAGEGRTGCALAAYLVRTRGLGAGEALRELRKIKPQFVEKGQETAVSQYASSLKH